MARTSKETYSKLLEQLGYEQHALTKTLYTMVVNGKKYGVDIKGREPDVFRLDGTERVNDISDEVIRNTNSVLIETAEPTKERAPPVNLESEQEYCNATPEVSEDETSTELPGAGEEVDIVEIPPSGSTEQADVADYDDDYVNEESIEVIEPEYEEPDVKKTKQIAPIQEGVQILGCIQNMDLRLAEAGKIKIGKKRAPKPGQDPNGFRPPEKLDHFIVTTTEFDKKTGDLKLDERVMAHLEKDCRLLRICLPYDDINLNFQSSYARYTKTKCLCRGDGVTARNEPGEIIPCNPQECEFGPNGTRTCKPSGILSVILEDAPSIGGVYKFRTTSWNSIRNIYSSLHFITSKITGGILAGLPLNMVLIPKTVQVPDGKGNKINSVIYMVNIEIPQSMSKMREIARDEAKLRAETLLDIRSIEANAAKQLAMQSAPSPEEVKEITEEFYPELHK